MEPKSLKDVRESLVELGKYSMVPVDLKDVDYDARGRFKVDNSSFFLSDLSTKEFCSLMGVSPASFRKGSESLKSIMVMELLKTQERSFKLILVQADKDTRVCRHILASDKPFIPLLSIFDAVAEVLGPLDPKVCFDTEKGLECLDFITKEETKLPKVNDVVRAGITVDNRTAGFQQSFHIGAYSQVLRCTNGAISNLENVLADIPAEADMDLIMNMVKASVQRAYSLSKEELIANMVKITDQNVEKDTTQFVHRMVKEHPIGGHRDMLLDRVPSLGDQPSVYQIMDMVTTYARDLPVLKQRRKLQEFGGYIASASDGCRCALCKTKLK